MEDGNILGGFRIVIDLQAHIYGAGGQQYIFPIPEVPTTLRPDAVLLFPPPPHLVTAHRSKGWVVLLELTSCFDDEQSFLNAQQRKDSRYFELTGLIRGAGYDVTCITLEVGCRGLVHKRGLDCLQHLSHDMLGCPLSVSRSFVRSLAKDTGQVALSTSYSIWAARRWVGQDDKGYQHKLIQERYGQARREALHVLIVCPVSTCALPFLWGDVSF